MVRFATLCLSKGKMSIYQLSIFDACGPVNKRFPKTIHVTLLAITGLVFRDKTTTDIILAYHLATELLDIYVP
ncbi:hypothetical protein GUJ93_ZPchr0010g9079 [Zizania palustris]|uniref:Uncharacterized protein n=1 Tax=Zizania palustris TaxID=103762 RepID=A0A8J6BNM0_ZIZPA|nr:hypothetical protein GUJ93_ZPchr0010g9079 [Zizania palustris]